MSERRFLAPLVREPMAPAAAAGAFLAVALDAIGRYHHSRGLEALTPRPEDRSNG